MIKCNFCNQDVEKLVKCHIIPEAFFQYIKYKSNSPKASSLSMVTNSNGQAPMRRSRKGWYDSKLVCLKCERKFSQYDNYAIRLLLKNEKNHKAIIVNGSLGGWEITSFDYNKLSLFFISVLWRASASSLPQFKRIKIGNIMDIAKKCIEKKSPDEKTFSFILSRFSDDMGRAFILDPHKEYRTGAYSKHHIYRFYLSGGYIIYINVDKNHPFPSPDNFFTIQKNQPLRINNKGAFIVSKEFSAMQRVHKDAVKALNIKRYN